MQTNSIEDKKFVTVMIKMVGTNCNMNCQYCYEHVTDDIHKDFSTSDQVIEYLKEFVNYEHVFIVFHGGEPLLANKSEVRNILDFIKANFGNEYRIQFQTNGTLLDDEWVNMFKQYEPNLSLSISLDPVGKKDLRKMNGLQYREIVEANLKRYCREIEKIGVISVAHKFNYTSFEEFVAFLISIGVKSLTINKYRDNDWADESYLTEKEYVKMLQLVFLKWVSNGWYKFINIQPLNSLFSPNGSKICIYLADEKKCSYFKTFYSEYEKSEFCDHVVNDELPAVESKCLSCEIYSKCGGGCLVEKKDETFCEARKELFKFVEGVKHGSKKTCSE